VGKGSRVISNELEYCLNDAFHRARAARHELLTVEHLLLGILDAPRVREILTGCGAQPVQLKQQLQEHIDQSTPRLDQSDGQEVRPTVGFERVLQRAVFHVQSSGNKEVSVANVLVAIFSEKQSHAVYLLQREHVGRADVVNYLAGGKRDVGDEKKNRVDRKTVDRKTVAQPKPGIFAVTGSTLRTARLLGPALIGIALTGWINQGLIAGPARPGFAAYVYLIGTVMFVAGLALIRAHNIWSRRWPVLITLVGWFAVSAGLGCMVAPALSLQVGQNAPVLNGLLLALLGVGIFLTTKAYKKSAG
jgi:Clp amino terminal domain, pathogenicity island component